MKRLIVLCLCLFVAACGVNRPHPLAVPSPFQIDQPFLGAERNDALIASIAETSSVVIDPIEGLRGSFNAALTADIAEEAQLQDIPLSEDPDARSADRLRGVFNARSTMGGGLVGAIDWRVETADGALIDNFQTSAPMRAFNAWTEEGFTDGNREWRRAIARATAAELAAALDARPMTARRLEGTEAPPPTEFSGPPIILPPVTGAPGDGNRSLARAVRALLEQEGIEVIDPAAPPVGVDITAAHRLQGSVQMGEIVPGAGEPITISWDLYAPDGTHQGNIAQQNLIEPGSLNGPWGEVSVLAAMGAVEGILALLSVIPNSGT
jgi:hypothetical protein